MINCNHNGAPALDPRRAALWKALWRYYFRHRIRPSDTVVDLGCGYGKFINNVFAQRRGPIGVRPQFLPLTAKSRLPVCGPLVGLFLASPVKLMGKQMLVRARPAL